MDENDFTAYEKALIRHSFSRVACRHEATTRLFFERMLALDPDCQFEAPCVLDEEGMKFARTLALLVKALDDPLVFNQIVRGLNVPLKHWPHAGEAFLWALEQCQGRDFTAPIRLAWQHFYAVMFTAVTMTGRADASSSG